MNESADLVMYWWDHAAGLLTHQKTVLRRFGFVTTNSITQTFQNQVVSRHLTAKNPISIVLAIPNHPWIKAAPDSAAVRIAMTVCQAGAAEGILRQVVREVSLNTDAPSVEFVEKQGLLNSDLTVGVDVTKALPLRSNAGICSPGVKLHGAGFIITPQEAEALGVGKRSGLEEHIREYRNGRDLTSRPRGVMVIDLYGLEAEDVRQRFPEVYQHVKVEVKEKIKKKDDGKLEYIGRDWNNRESYRKLWWIFGEPREEIRPALHGLDRYIVTPVTQKHRIFEFISGHVLPDDALMIVAVDDGFCIGVLFSKVFLTWFSMNSSTLEDRPRFIKSRCFDPFPFPAADDLQKHRIRAIAEDLDAHRKRVLAEHPHLTLTGLYNVLEKLRAGVAPADLDAADRRVFDDGLVLILKECHDNLDAAVAAAYGWAADLGENEILANLVALNQERVREEAAGHVRWLRPEYQVPRFGNARDKLALTGGAMNDPATAATTGPKPSFPASELEQTVAVLSVLASAAEPLNATALSVRFRQGRRVLPQVEAVLAALARVGGLVASPDGGRSFLPRRAA